MIDAPQLDALARILFPRDSACAVFAVLDGCMIKQLPQRLRESGCDYTCLFSGRLDPELEAAAPFLVQLKSDAAFTRSVLADGWNKHWGIVLHGPAHLDLAAVRDHLRHFLRVTGPGGKPMYFRFYDPRAFRVTIPCMRRGDYREFMGPLQAVFTEGTEAHTVLHFAARGAPKATPLPLKQPAISQA